jgi:hypothetical protein
VVGNSLVPPAQGLLRRVLDKGLLVIVSSERRIASRLSKILGNEPILADNAGV